MYLLSTTHLTIKIIHRLEVKNGKRFCVNRKQKGLGVVMLISDRIDFTTKTVERDQVEHYAVTKASAQ